jgi:ubiquinone/menaquinone biosynthesis C-methylase UbiE
MNAVEIDQRRQHVHGMWAAVAPQWADYADDVDRRGERMTARILELAEIRSGQHVLELAGGPGGAGLAAAEIVGTQGSVVISDVVPEMVKAAASRARQRGLANVETAVLDIEAIDRPPGTFDVVLCREGLMFAVDPLEALSEIRRVLRPNGRLAFSVWGHQDANPWLGVVIDAVTAVTGTVIPPPGMPGPFALSDQTALVALLEAAGFESVSIEELAVPLRSPSFESWWSRTAAVAGPVVRIIAGLDASKRVAMEEDLRAATASYTTDDGLVLPGVALIGCGRRPE